MKFPGSDSLSFLALGVSGESGEIADHVKKSIRDDRGVISDERRELILKEIGDVMWYLNKMTRVLGSSLEEVCKINVDKLTSRINRGKFKGSGDNR